jgi:NAD(P)-dependent dehydrogenase (short-subunit alcohol dehydrogenase family)
MTGRTCLITGSTSGIGEATGRALARLGASVIVQGRDPARCERVTAAICEASDNPNVEHVVADLASLAQVRRLAAELHARTDRLDVLVNNAGAMLPSYRETEDGFEQTFAVNHLAPFLLTNLGIPDRKRRVWLPSPRRAGLRRSEFAARWSFGLP